MASIREAAEKLSEKGNRIEEISRKFEDIEEIETGSTVKESFLSKKVKPEKPEKVAGVDGGIVKKRYSSGDIVGVRAVAAVFSFGDELEADYIPGKSPEPEFHVFDAKDAESIERNAETERLRHESSVILEALENKPLVLADGSIVPSYLEDDEVLENFEEIFEKSSPGQLAGVVEDSYGRKMGSILEQKLGVNTAEMRDTRIMDAVLEEEERSFVRRYSSSPVEHPVLQKLQDRHVNRLHTFYLKVSQYDLPLRIDYFGTPEEADSIASALLYLKSSESYVIPSPIVEADKRAKISENYIKRLEKRFSPDLRRRERRSF